MRRDDRGDQERTWLVDPFSSGISFPGGKELEHELVMWRPPSTYDPLIVWIPKTWLLRWLASAWTDPVPRGPERPPVRLRPRRDGTGIGRTPMSMFRS